MCEVAFSLCQAWFHDSRQDLIIFCNVHEKIAGENALFEASIY